MHKKFVWIIIAVLVLTFANSLFNGFIGDDEVVVVHNKFYRSLANLPRLFQQGYITNNINIFIGVEQDMHSGSVAYRPVLSLTFFVDYFLWKLNPAGYHLTNLILHLFNCLLVYFIAFAFLKDKRTALLSALLFCVHPTKAEPVCSIGYRADTLSTVFVLSSFLLFIRHKVLGGIQRNFALAGSYLCFFLALFTKESAIILPVLLFAHEFYFGEGREKFSLKGMLPKYGAFLGITCVYLYFYLFVFRNNNLAYTALLGANWIEHAETMALIFGNYMLDLLYPASVDIVPPLYAPKLGPWAWVQVTASLILLAGLIVFVIRNFRKKKIASYFMLWFLIGLAPVSNIIPLPNPMAHRFLYLPSVGFFIAAAMILTNVLAEFKKHQNVAKVGEILKVGIVVLCVLITIPLNRAWNNNFSVGERIIRRYPLNPQGYLIFGLECIRTGFFDHAKIFLEQSLELGLEDPRLFHSLGLCNLDQPEVARKYFMKAIEMFPGFSISYAGVGRTLLFQKKYSEAAEYLQKSIELSPMYTAYGYLIQAYILMGEEEKARSVWESATATLKHDGKSESLKKFLDSAEALKEPIDIGL